RLKAVQGSLHDIYGFLLLSGKKEILPPGARFLDVDRREHSLLLKPAVKDKFHIAGSLKLLVDHIVHFASCIHQRGGQDRQAAALPHLSGRAEKPLLHMQSRRIKSSGESSSAGRNT